MTTTTHTTNIVSCAPSNTILWSPSLVSAVTDCVDDVPTATLPSVLAAPAATTSTTPLPCATSEDIMDWSPSLIEAVDLMRHRRLRHHHRQCRQQQQRLGCGPGRECLVPLGGYAGHAIWFSYHSQKWMILNHTWPLMSDTHAGSGWSMWWQDRVYLSVINLTVTEGNSVWVQKKCARGWVQLWVQTLYQFYGCYWHSHECHKTAKQRQNAEDANRLLFMERRNRTNSIAQYLRETVKVNVVKM